MMKKNDRPAKAKKESRKEAVAFDIDAAELPEWIDEQALTSGGYPYDKKLKREEYDAELQALQIELLKLQGWALKTGARVVVFVDGRDAAGKGGSIKRFMEHLNPRHATHVALLKPTEVERGQWYFQRHIAHMPTAGEIVVFERSWYNRAGVETVMGFCAPEETQKFLREAPQVEAALIRDGIYFFKIWLSIGRAMQLKRFHDRRHDPLKQWKLSDIDLAAIGKWDAYSGAAEEMFRHTHTTDSPWTVIRANDKRRTRLNVMRAVLAKIPYEGKDAAIVGTPDPKLVGSGPAFFVMPKA
jgi:polyphosphate kinase